MFSFFPFLFCNLCFEGLWILHRYRVAFPIHNSTLRNFVSSSRNQIFRFCFLKLYFFLFVFTAKVICAVLATVNNGEINRIKHFSSQNKLYSDEIKVWRLQLWMKGSLKNSTTDLLIKMNVWGCAVLKYQEKKKIWSTYIFECTNNDHILNKHLVKMNEINGLFRNTWLKKYPNVPTSFTYSILL